MDRKRKITLIFLAAAVALFFVGTAARCTAKIGSSDEPVDQASIEEARAGDEAEGNEQPTTDKVQYSGKERELIEYLEAAKWVDASGRVTAEFADGAITEQSVDGVAKTTEFVIETLDAKPNVSTAVIEACGEHLTLVLTLPVEGEATVSSRAFAMAQEYKKAGNHKCEVAGMDEAAAELIDGETSALTSALQSYCEASAPSVRSVTFAGTVMIDTKVGTVTLYFTPDSIDGLTLQVVYSEADRSFKCSTAGAEK